MRRLTLVAILLMAATTVAIAQNSAIPPKVLAEIQSALKNIAIRNYTVENIIYDGMTYREVSQILGETFHISADANWAEATGGMEYMYVSYHGNYVLFWSDSDYLMGNPTVIGYANVRTKRVQHNTLR